MPQLTTQSSIDSPIIFFRLEWILEEFTDAGEAIITIKMSDVPKNHLHPLTRPLKGEKRAKVQQKLLTATPETFYRSIQIDETLMEEDNNLQDIKSISTLSKAKSEYLNKLNNDQDHFIDISKEMQKTKSEFIKFVAMNPYMVIAHSNLQLTALKKMMQNGGEIVCHIDATGNVVAPPACITKRVFYYAIVIVFKTNSNDKNASVVPLSELVSSSHTTDDVGIWLHKVRHFVTNYIKQWPVINRAVTDESWVQLHSICENWNLVKFQEYINITYKWINELPTDYSKQKMIIISLCCAHKIKNIVKDVKAYLNNNHKVIVEILVSMINMTSYDDMKQLWGFLTLILKSKMLTPEVKNAIQKISKIISPNVAVQIADSLSKVSDPDKEEKYEIENKTTMV